ncbi:methylmalonyl-CoA mutase subunit beta [Methylocapsa sp. D3K7]|uniref:methylmalonyl-CoA mutase subunit beta n=1 Tax=Methylocapsa sp. D3K7 TaxID=3041435 RepID=UPI00244EB364|nr:methylmalonyl-CoA mutase subunit beta [Methylocapsa sp. D3K7]WGJ13661.1 methylmalonyl-CoA mutase subunit beta [Methylocapsa sp. D3K7]
MEGPTNPFPPASEAEWRNLVERGLGGKPFESLISTTFEGLSLAPLYERVIGEGPRPLRQKPGPWKIAQRIDHPDIVTANAMARADLMGGADALTLTISQSFAARGFGLQIESERDLDAAFAGIDLDRIALRVDADARALDLAALFVSIAKARRLTSAELDVDFGHDPIGHFARCGHLPAGALQGLGNTLTLLHGNGFAGHLFLADGRPYHEAGAGEAQELACVLATGIEYLRLLEAEGLPLEAARRDIAFLLAADADEYLSLAKFRAMRLLWARVEDACGLTPKPIRLHAETAFRMMTRYDPWVNILRATMGVFAAGAGGADTVTVLPFTLALGLPDDVARRIARNTQSILIEESHLAKVADPAAGAGSFEALTSALCNRAWALLQDIEAQGGMIKSLQTGTPQREIGVTAAARRDAIAQRALAITGTSAFPLLTEAPVHVLAPPPVRADDDFTVYDNIHLPSRRDAEPFESLRVASDKYFQETGSRPKIFLTQLGEPQGVAPASDFATHFFAVAGLEVFSQEGCDAAQHFRVSGCKIACIFAAATVSAADLIETAARLSDAGAARIYLAGPVPEPVAKALHDAGVAELICPHRDALAILRESSVMTLRRTTKLEEQKP